jgi:DNA-binding beta-propeller fold protein YncE
MKRWIWLAGALATAGACGGDKGLSTAPPGEVTMVTADGFDSPMDAVASPDGETFYFSAHMAGADAAVETSAAIYQVAASGGAPEILVMGSPLEDPSGLLVSCDGSTLYIADSGIRAGDADLELDDPSSPVYAFDLASATLTALPVDGVAEAASLAMGPDCETIYITGFTADDQPALFTTGLDGATAAVAYSGEPLSSPSGVFVDADRVAWVMDHLPGNMLGGALFAITADGEASIVVDGLALSEPAGVSLVAGGETAVIPTQNEDGDGQLLHVNTRTGESGVVESTMLNPAGIRTAREANVMAVVDSDGDAIYRAQ